MPRLSLSALALAAALTLPATPLLAQSQESEQPADPVAEQPAPEGLETDEQRYSYGLGMQIGQTLIQQGISDGTDPDAFVMGIVDVLKGVEPRLSLEQIQEAYMAFQVAQAEAQAGIAAENLARGEAFLAENATADGITVTESGLQYRVLEDGEGDSPTADSVVRVHYEGQLLSGETFDSSYARGTPAEFPVGGVIPGWTEALQLMKPGAVWEVWLPADIAYGERGAGGDIGPNEVLFFKIELLEVLE